MPKLDKDPDSLRPYLFHGVDLKWKSDTDGEANGDCPFCGREGKFNVNVETSLYRCVVCESAGNPHVFIRELWKASDEATKSYADLAQDRKLLNPDSLMAWGVCRSITTGEWLVPGYGINRHLNQLYRYVRIAGKMRLIPTPTLGHQLFGLNGTFEPSKKSLYVCEGPWDGIALWEALNQTKQSDGKCVPTSNPEASLASSVNVIAVPGCKSMFTHWLPLFADKDVCLLYDNDHERQHPKTGGLIQPAGYAAMAAFTGLLSEAETPPSSIKFLQWGKDGMPFDPDYPSGYDIRDYLGASGTDLGPRINALGQLLGKITDVPPTWLGEATKGVKTKAKKANSLATLQCKDYRSLTTAWRKALKWTDGLDCALSVMLASITSTMQVGDQLWIKIIGPASCGKSTLCEAISTSAKYVLAKSTMRGFHSGYHDGEEGGEDHSLLAKVSGKTLVTKDGDTLLQSPNLGQILSEARDVYDTVSRTSYRNKASKDYAGIRMTWLLCGTSSLRSIDSSELGERFLDCVIMEGIDDDLEDEILWRVAHRAERNLSIQADNKASTHQEPEMTAVMQLTGGYVEYLRENATELLSSIEMSDDAKKVCTRLGKFVAFMRARPSTRQDETAEREFAARLVSQHIRLAKCLSVVLNSSEVCDEAMRRTRKVSMDTARGVTLNIVRRLYHAENGMTLGGLSQATNQSEYKTRELLRFLRMIGVVNSYQKDENGFKGQTRYKLTPKLALLYHDVTGETTHDD